MVGPVEITFIMNPFSDSAGYSLIRMALVITIRSSLRAPLFLTEMALNLWKAYWTVAVSYSRSPMDKKITFVCGIVCLTAFTGGFLKCLHTLPDVLMDYVICVAWGISFILWLFIGKIKTS